LPLKLKTNDPVPI